MCGKTQYYLKVTESLRCFVYWRILLLVILLLVILSTLEISGCCKIIGKSIVSWKECVCVLGVVSNPVQPLHFERRGGGPRGSLKDGSRVTINVHTFLKNKVMEFLDSLLFRCRSFPWL